MRACCTASLMLWLLGACAMVLISMFSQDANAPSQNVLMFAVALVSQALAALSKSLKRSGRLNASVCCSVFSISLAVCGGFISASRCVLSSRASVA